MLKTNYAITNNSNFKDLGFAQANMQSPITSENTTKRPVHHVTWKQVLSFRHWYMLQRSIFNFFASFYMHSEGHIPKPMLGYASNMSAVHGYFKKNEELEQHSTQRTTRLIIS